MNKDNLSIKDITDLSKSLHKKYEETWEPMTPEHARDSILYMIEEVGEVISVIKKKSIEDIMEDQAVRSHLVEEMTDVLMYFSDALNRFKISPEEFSQAYVKKFEKNLSRDFHADHQSFIKEGSDD